MDVSQPIAIYRYFRYMRHIYMRFPLWPKVIPTLHYSLYPPNHKLLHTVFWYISYGGRTVRHGHTWIVPIIIDIPLDCTNNVVTTIDISGGIIQ